MSSHPPDPFDQSSPDSFSPSAADPVDRYPSDPVEPVNQSPDYNNPLAVGSLVSGLLSVVLTFSCFCCGPLALLVVPTSIVAIVLGMIALRQVKAGKGTGRGLAISGIICGAVVLLLIMAVIGFLVASGNNDFNNLDQWMELQQREQQNLRDIQPGEVTEEPDPALGPADLEMDLIPVDPDAKPSPSPTPKTSDDGSPTPPGP